jgi:hypothetical protein
MYWTNKHETTSYLHLLFFSIYENYVPVLTPTSTIQISLFYRFTVLLPYSETVMFQKLYFTIPFNP